MPTYGYRLQDTWNERTSKVMFVLPRTSGHQWMAGRQFQAGVGVRPCTNTFQSKWNMTINQYDRYLCCICVDDSAHKFLHDIVYGFTCQSIINNGQVLRRLIELVALVWLQKNQFEIRLPLRKIGNDYLFWPAYPWCFPTLSPWSWQQTRFDSVSLHPMTNAKKVTDYW